MLDMLRDVGLDLDDLLAATDASLKVYENQPHSNYGIACSVYTHEEDSNQVIVAFRGTYNAADIASDISLLVGAKSERLKAHISAICKELKSNLEGKQVLITGHSLGGATAVQAAIETGWPAIAFDAPAFKSWERLKEKPENILLCDSQKNMVNRVKFDAKKGFKRISLSQPMKAFLSGRGDDPLASHRMRNIRQVICDQIPQSLEHAPILKQVNGLRHDLSVGRFNVETGVFGKPKSEVPLFQTKWEREVDDSLLDDLASLTRDIQPIVGEDGDSAEKKHQTKILLKASRHLIKEKLNGLQTELKFWNKAKRSGLNQANEEELDPDTKQKVQWLKEKAKTVGVEVQRLRAAFQSEKTRTHALNKYRQQLNREMQALEIEFDEVKFTELATMDTPDLRKGVDLLVLSSVASSCQARCDAQRRIVGSFRHAYERAETYSSHASFAQSRHEDYHHRFQDISKRLKALSGPSLLHIYGNYQEASAKVMSQSGHPIAVALSKAVSFGNGLLQGNRDSKVAMLQHDFQAYQALDRQAQAAYAQAMGQKDKWMTATNELTAIILQNPNLLGADDCHQLLVQQSQALAKDEKAIAEALEAQEKEVARLEKELIRFATKEKSQKGKRKRKTQREQSELREALASAQFRADQLRDSGRSNRTAQRDINPTAAAVVSNRATLNSLDTLIERHSAHEKRAEDNIYASLDSSKSNIDKSTWDNHLDEHFADACNPELNREQQRDAFADKVIADMAIKGVTLTREQANQIYDDKLARAGMKVVLDKVQMAKAVMQEKHRVQDQLLGEGFAAASMLIQQLKLAGLLSRIPGEGKTVQTATKVVQMGQQAYQVYTVTRDTIGFIELLATLRANADEGTKLALATLTGNYVAIAINLVKMASGLLQIYNTASDNHPEFSHETKAILSAIASMRKSLENSLDTIKEELGYIRSDLESVKLDVEQIKILMMGDAERQRLTHFERAEGAKTLDDVMVQAQRVSQNKSVLGAQSIVAMAKDENVTGAATKYLEVCDGPAYLRNSHIAGHLPGMIQFQTGISAKQLSNPYVLSNLAAQALRQPEGREQALELSHIEQSAKAMLAFSDELRAMNWAKEKFDTLQGLVESIVARHIFYQDETKERLVENMSRVTHFEGEYEAPCPTHSSNPFSRRLPNPDNWTNALAKTLFDHCGKKDMRHVNVSVSLNNKGPNQTTLELKDGFIACPTVNLKQQNFYPVLLPEKLLSALSKKHQPLHSLMLLEDRGLIGLRFKYDLLNKSATALDKAILHPIPGFGLNLIIEAIIPGKSHYERIGTVPITSFIPRVRGGHSSHYQDLLHVLYGLYYRYSDTSPVDRGRGYVSLECDSVSDKLWHEVVWLPPLMLVHAIPWGIASRARSDAHMAMVYPGLYGVMDNLDLMETLSSHPYHFVRKGLLNIGTGSVNVAQLCDWKPEEGHISYFYPWQTLDTMKWPANPREDYKKIDPPEQGGGKTPRYKPPRTIHPKLELSRPKDRSKLNKMVYTAKAIASPEAEQAVIPDDYANILPTDELLEIILARCESNYQSEIQTGDVAKACSAYEKIYATFVYMLRHEFNLNYSETVSFLNDKVGLIHPGAFQVMLIQSPERLPEYAAQISNMHELDWATLFAAMNPSQAHQILQNLSVSSRFSSTHPPVLELEQHCRVESDLKEVVLLHEAMTHQSMFTFRRDYTAEALAPLLDSEEREIDVLSSQLGAFNIRDTAGVDCAAGVSASRADVEIDELVSAISEMRTGDATYVPSGGPSRDCLHRGRRPRGDASQSGSTNPRTLMKHHS